MSTSVTLFQVPVAVPCPTYRTWRAAKSGKSYVSRAVVVPLLWPLHTVVHETLSVETCRSKRLLRDVP